MGLRDALAGLARSLTGGGSSAPSTSAPRPRTQVSRAFTTFTRMSAADWSAWLDARKRGNETPRWRALDATEAMTLQTDVWPRLPVETRWRLLHELHEGERPYDRYVAAVQADAIAAAGPDRDDPIRDPRPFAAFHLDQLPAPAVAQWTLEHAERPSLEWWELRTRIEMDALPLFEWVDRGYLAGVTDPRLADWLALRPAIGEAFGASLDRADEIR